MKRSYIIPALILILYGCNTATEKRLSEARPVTNASGYSSSCPFLAKDNRGSLVMSWVKEINDTGAVLCISILDESGNFPETYEIPASKGLHPHGENLPKIACKPDGTLLAMWGMPNPNPDNKYSGLVSYAVSKNGGKDWSQAIFLVTDTSSYDQRYFDIEVLPDGEIAAVWLDSRLNAREEGSTLFYAVTDSNNRFVAEKPIAETCCPCCRTDLFIDKKGNIHVAFRDIIQDSIRDMVHIASNDNGSTFSPPVRIGIDDWVIHGCPHTGPTLAENDKGLHFSWYTMGNGEGVFYSISMDYGKRFSAKESISSDATAKHPQIAAVDNQDIFIVWDQVVKHGDDFNNMILLQHRSPEGKVIATDSVTTHSDIAYFPVVRQSNNNSLVIAYTLQQNDRKMVYYNTYTVR